MHHKIFLGTLLIQLACFSAVSAQQQLTPRETVALFEDCYGTDIMDTCVDLVTIGFRGDKPGSVWVYDTWTMLDAINYQREDSEVLQEKIDGDTAYVVLQSRVYILDSFVDQKELYELLRFNGVWLINDLRVGDEVLEMEEKKERL